MHARAVATPLGLVIRGLSRGYVPATPFILVTLAATGVLMVGWRTALAFATPKARGEGAYNRIGDILVTLRKKLPAAPSD